MRAAAGFKTQETIFVRVSSGIPNSSHASVKVISASAPKSHAAASLLTTLSGDKRSRTADQMTAHQRFSSGVMPHGTTVSLFSVSMSR